MRLNLLPWCLGLALAVLAGAGCSDRDAETPTVDAADRARAAELGAQAGDLAAALDYAGARTAWTKARRLDPGHEGARLALAAGFASPSATKQAVALGREAQAGIDQKGPLFALETVGRARELDALHRGLREMEAKLLARVRRFVEADEAAGELRALYPRSPEGWILGAEIASTRRDLPRAKALVLELRAKVPVERRRAQENRELYLLATSTVGNRDEGDADPIELLRELVKRDPTNVEYRDLLANLLATAGEFAAEEVQLRAMIERGNDDYRTWTRLGVCLERRLRDREALECFTTAATKPGGPGRARISAARIRARLPEREEWERGREEIERILADVPDDIDALTAGVALMTKLGRGDEAAALAETLEVARAKEQRKTDRMRALKEHLASHPEDAASRQEFVAYLFARRDAGEAMAIIRPLLLRHPDDADGLAWSARFLLETGRTDAAWWEARRLTETSPEDPRGAEILALVSAAVARPEAVVAWGHRALDLGSSARELLFALQASHRALGDKSDPRAAERVEQLIRETIGTRPNEGR
ncbi:MAG: hypothetical protein R3F20_19825 [Planctomycetota bacterium]